MCVGRELVLVPRFGLSLPHPCLGMSAGGSSIVLVHMATLWGPVTRQLQVLLWLPWRRFFNDVVAAPCPSLHYGWSLAPPPSTHPKHTHTHTHTYTHTHSLLSLVTAFASKGWLELTIPQRAGVDIHTGSIVLETERGGSGEAVLLTNPETTGTQESELENPRSNNWTTKLTRFV